MNWDLIKKDGTILRVVAQLFVQFTENNSKFHYIFKITEEIGV